MKTSAEWWLATKSDPAKLNHWLQRQYVGEMAAVNLLSELLIRFGDEATDEEWKTVHKVMQQEAIHARWMKEVMDKRGVKPEANGESTRRYWQEVIPAVTNFREAMAAGFDAEHMRLDRIRVIANDDSAPPDLFDVFNRILPHEEWHEQVFNEMRHGITLTEAHDRGLNSLGLVLQ